MFPTDALPPLIAVCVKSNARPFDLDMPIKPVSIRPISLLLLAAPLETADVKE